MYPCLNKIGCEAQLDKPPPTLLSPLNLTDKYKKQFSIRVNNYDFNNNFIVIYNILVI